MKRKSKGGQEERKESGIMYHYIYTCTCDFHTDPLYRFGSGGENIISQVPGKVSIIIIVCVNVYDWVYMYM